MSQVKIIRPSLMEWTGKHTKDCDIAMLEKKLLEDEKSSMEVSIAHYPAGYRTVWHKHTVSHGMYVLDGRLRTSEGVLEKGDFIWFPAGVEMEHGATEDGDCTVLFITNGVFDIEYVSR